MRRLILRLRHETRGAASVLVALTLVVLLGAAAIAVDVGAMYAERAELQNGADAAVLAIAQDCANGSAACGSAATTAQSFADRNAKDGAANAAVLSLTASSVRVQTTTREAGTGAGALALNFAPVLGIDATTVGARAEARWGSPARGPAMLPLAFAPCVFNSTGTIQLIQTHGSGTSSCTSTSPSGQTLPGGFGWLARSDGSCSTTVDIANPAAMSGDSGTSIPDVCKAVLTSLAGREVILPVYSDKNGSGASGTYRIQGWAAFRILGWRFPGFNYDNTRYPGATCTGDCQGLIGQFVSFVSLDDRFTLGGPSMGASVVQMSE